MLAAGFLVYLGVRLWHLWRRDSVDLGHLAAGGVVLAVAASALAVASYGVIWLYVLRRFRIAVSLYWLTVFFKSQLGKYLPGSVWQYAGRVGIARRHGLGLGVGLASIGVEIAASSIAAAAAGLLVLDAKDAAAALVGVAVLLVAATAGWQRVAGAASRFAKLAASRVGIEGAVLRSAVSTVPIAVVLYLVVWALYGISFWLTARALFGASATPILVYVGTFALAWLAGFAAVFAPGGVGVREAVIVAMLSSRLGEANAIVLAASSRVVLTAIDLVAGGLSIAVSLRPRRENDAKPLPDGPA
jgi:uncharacterized membrane protein YbhN (UPF0104 family)